MSDPENGDASRIFTTRDAAEEFVAGDPFVRHGVVRGWTIRAWDDALGVFYQVRE